jgi:hypothetical protein
MDWRLEPTCWLMRPNCSAEPRPAGRGLPGRVVLMLAKIFNNWRREISDLQTLRPAGWFVNSYCVKKQIFTVCDEQVFLREIYRTAL